MVYTKIITTKEVEERYKFCDVWGTEIHIGLTCGVARCEYCKKDLCEECIGHEEGTLGDYRSVYCKKCWDIGTKYRTELEKLEYEVEQLYKKWKDECNS